MRSGSEALFSEPRTWTGCGSGPLAEPRTALGSGAVQVRFGSFPIPDLDRTPNRDFRPSCLRNQTKFAYLTTRVPQKASIDAFVAEIRKTVLLCSMLQLSKYSTKSVGEVEPSVTSSSSSYRRPSGRGRR